MTTLQDTFDKLVEDRFSTIAGAHFLEQNPAVSDQGRAYNAKRSLMGKIAILHTILRFKFITPSNAQYLLCHKNLSTTSSFLKRMMNQKLIRRVKTKWPENPFVYAFVYDKAKTFLEEQAKIFIEHDLNDGKFDSSRYSLTESVRHLELVQREAIYHSKNSDVFLTEYELKKLTTNHIFNMKFCDLLVIRPFEKDDGSTGREWRGIEVETSMKSRKKLLHGVGRANQLIQENCIGCIYWYVDPSYIAYFEQLLAENNEIPNITYPNVASGGFSRKLQQIGTTTIVKGHFVRAFESKYSQVVVKEKDIHVSDDDLWNIYGDQN